MTLNDFLIELGYKHNSTYKGIADYRKRIKDVGFIEISISENKVVNACLIQTHRYIYGQSDIDRLQIAFNDLKRDTKLVWACLD